MVIEISTSIDPAIASMDTTSPNRPSSSNNDHDSKEERSSSLTTTTATKPIPQPLSLAAAKSLSSSNLHERRGNPSIGELDTTALETPRIKCSPPTPDDARDAAIKLMANHDGEWRVEHRAVSAVDYTSMTGVLSICVCIKARACRCIPARYHLFIRRT